MNAPSAISESERPCKQDSENHFVATSEPGPGRWQALASRVLAGETLPTAEALAILAADDSEILELLAAAYQVRRRYFGRQVQLYYLINAKSGLCPEDCGYCSQSKVSKAKIPKYNLIQHENLMEGARQAAERQAKTYCLVISARGPSEQEMQAVEKIVPEIKRKFKLRICGSLGLLTPEQAHRLKACGVDRINHNLNTSSEYYARICSTHEYQDRLDTLRRARDAGLELCSGGIIGMGEAPEDVVRMARKLRDLGVDSIPVNFYHPIEGTPLADNSVLTPNYCLKVLAMFRMVNPDCEIRIAGGRELHLGSMQAMGLYAANSIFVGDYLTSKGQLPKADYAMIRDLGFEIVENEPEKI
jgi:biotin synthase